MHSTAGCVRRTKRGKNGRWVDEKGSIRKKAKEEDAKRGEGCAHLGVATASPLQVCKPAEELGEKGGHHSADVGWKGLCREHWDSIREGRPNKAPRKHET
jgi:hypothetical protein